MNVIIDTSVQSILQPNEVQAVAGTSHQVASDALMQAMIDSSIINLMSTDATSVTAEAVAAAPPPPPLPGAFQSCPVPVITQGRYTEVHNL